MLSLRVVSYYITDLPQFTSLAPCARSGLSYGVFANTYSLCPEGPQALASCACLKEGMSVYASSEITSSVRYYCSSNVADVTSALAVRSPIRHRRKPRLTTVGVEPLLQRCQKRDPPGRCYQLQ